jgi:hypothetical protein
MGKSQTVSKNSKREGKRVMMSGKIKAEMVPPKPEEPVVVLTMSLRDSGYLISILMNEGTRGSFTEEARSTFNAMLLALRTAVR